MGGGERNEANSLVTSGKVIIFYKHLNKHIFDFVDDGAVMPERREKRKKNKTTFGKSCTTQLISNEVPPNADKKVCLGALHLISVRYMD